jgi:LPXTG-site transpeptidase (sortase) family protein
VVSGIRLYSGRYKTHFQKIIELEEGEEIWIYKKQENGEYRRYKYRTEVSYEVNPKDTSILSPGIGKNLTLFTCTPIGWITGRWVVQAKYIDEEKSNLEDILYGKLLTTKQKKEIQSYFRTLKPLSLEKKEEHLLQKYNAIALEDKSSQRDYFLLQLAKTYGELR